MLRYSKRSSVSRRRFLKESTIGMLGITAALRGEQATRAASPIETNPYAYDLGRLAKTDPKLIQFEEVGRIRSSRQDARRLAIGTKDEVYLCAGNYVSIFESSGALQSEIALNSPARGLTVSESGDVYIALRDHIEVYGNRGERKATWTTPAPKTWLTGLALKGKELFAADAGNRAILRCDLSGQVLGRFGQKGNSSPGLIVPSPFLDIEVHKDGLLRINNPGRHRVEAYTTDGDFEGAWGRPSAAIDGFCGCCNPINLAVLRDGRIVTCEKGLPRVKVYEADGTMESVVAGPESFPENSRVSAGDSLSDLSHGGLDVAVDSKGRIYILDLVTAEIRVMGRKKGEKA